MTALVQSPEKITEKSDRLIVIKGLPTDIDDVRKANLNCDKVISTLNPISEKDLISLKKIQPARILEKSIQNAIECIGEFKIKKNCRSFIHQHWRYLSVSALVYAIAWKTTNFRNSFDDHNEQESLLMNSDLDWVIARPVSLNNNESLQNLVINYDKKTDSLQNQPQTTYQIFSGLFRKRRFF